MVKGLLHILEAPKRLSRECIEPLVGSALETGWEHTTKEQIVVSGPPSFPGIDGGVERGQPLPSSTQHSASRTSSESDEK